MTNVSDDFFMKKAFCEANRAKGRTGDRPPVGVVVVNNNKIVGKGFTQYPPGPHAEVVALVQAGDRAAGATLYTTLEPCTFFARTPPCTDMIVIAGISKVCFALIDPNIIMVRRASEVLIPMGINVCQLPSWKEAAEALMKDYLLSLELDK